MSHQDLDIPAIEARINRMYPDEPGLSRDVALISGELEYVAGEFLALQRNISDIISNLHGAVERLGELQRGSQPDSDHRPHS